MVENGNKYIRYLSNYINILNIDSLNAPMKRDYQSESISRSQLYVLSKKPTLFIYLFYIFIGV